MFKKLLAWFREEKGQDLVEYGLITGAISLVICLAAAVVLVPAFANWASDIGTAISSSFP